MKKNNAKKTKCFTAGFTIIEMMIAIAIFLVVVIFGMQSLLNASFMQKKTQSMRSLYDSLTFALDDMSKNIRVGSEYHCIKEYSDFNDITSESTKSCDDGIGISFESSTGTAGDGTDQWVYFISGNKLYKSTGPSYSGVDSYAIQMTPDDVVLDEQASGFSVLGAEAPADGDKQQPLVIIRLVGKMKNDISFSVETAASQRLIDTRMNPVIITPVTPLNPVFPLLPSTPLVPGVSRAVPLPSDATKNLK